MDEKQISELLECSVCLERLDQSCKVLPCQHTFCRRCLDEIVLTKHELRCPECRALVTQRVADLPTNILVVRILEGLKTQGYKAAVGSDGGKLPPGYSSKVGLSPTKQLGTSPHKSRSDTRGFQSFQHLRQGQQQSFAKALYDYESAEKEDLIFKKGDIIQLRRQIDENWYQGELSGKMGYFPANFVKVIIPLPQVPQSRALYDFDLKDENEKDCLSFQKDEILTVIRRVDDNWLEGRKGDKIGIFPLSFVELNDAARVLISSKANMKSSSTSAPSVPVSTSVISSTTVTTVSTGSSPSALITTSTNSSSVPSPSVSPDSGLTANSESSNLMTPSLSTSPSSGPTSSTAVTPTMAAETVTLSSSPNLAEPFFGDSTQNKRHSYSSSPSRFSPVLSNSPSQQRHSMEVTLSVESSQNQPNVPSLNSASLDTTATGTSFTLSSVSASAERNNSGTVSPLIPPPSSPANVQEESQETASPSQGGQSDSAQPPALPNPLYVAIYNYLPQKEDELELQKGDHYVVVEKCQDGWFKGSCVKTGESGVFPGNYVSIIRHTSAFKPVNPNVLNIRAKAPTSSTVSSLPTNPVTSNSPHHHFVGSNSNVTVPAQSQGAPPLLPRVPKNNSSGQKPGHFSNPPMRSISSPGNSSRPIILKHSLSEITSTSTRIPPVPSTSLHSTSPSHRSFWGTAAPGLMHQSLTQPSSASPINIGMATSVDSAQTLFEFGKDKEKDKDKDKDKKKKKDKEKRSFLKLLKDKKSKQLSTEPEVIHSIPVVVTLDSTPHTRGGSYPMEATHSIVSGNDTALMVSHRKISSFESTSPPPVPAKPRPRPLPRERYCCIVPYPPQTDYELCLELGDIIHVHRKREDGWYKGTQERTGKTGMFPASFVEKCT